MDDKIEPALSAEEWAKAQQGHRVHRDGKDYSVDSVSLEIERWDDAVEIFPEGLHALAALCLHGQPFGFTQEDVERLRDAPELYGGLHGSADREWRKYLNGLANRIAALLPPSAPVSSSPP